MPTVLLLKGFRFFFYSNESGEPIHVHIMKGEDEGKIWLEPSMEIAYLHRFTNSEAKDILDIIKENSEYFKQRWNEYFG
ncbi:MAG: DUF4160 domain-containing protein [Chitinophagaceae bacterium]